MNETCFLSTDKSAIWCIESRVQKRCRRNDGTTAELTVVAVVKRKVGFVSNHNQFDITTIRSNVSLPI
jgi:hypothetical protein